MGIDPGGKPHTISMGVEGILTDHPDRFRAALVETANPVHSLADGPRMREAFEALELVVVVDVALTETARLADYVLPMASQFEKAEATFFNFEYPANYFHLRSPLLDPPEGLDEQGIKSYVETTAAIYNKTEFGAIYWPRIKVQNPSEAIFGTTESRPALELVVPWYTSGA